MRINKAKGRRGMRQLRGGCGQLSKEVLLEGEDSLMVAFIL